MTGITIGEASGQIYRLPPPDTLAGNFFGASVAIDNDTALIGATGVEACGANSGAAYVYRRLENGDWIQTRRLLPEDCHEDHFFGRSVALSGNRAIVTSHRPYFRESTSNAAYVFERDEGTNEWRQTARIEDPSTDRPGPFANSIALDGDRLLITNAGDATSGRFHGAAHIFEYDADGGWKHAARLDPSSEPETGIFGTSAALNGDRVVVSASTYFENEPGQLYVYDRSPATDTWLESARIGGIQDFFISVDVDGDQIIAGESHGGRHESGRARIFSRTADGIWKTTATLRPSSPYAHGGFGSEVSLSGDRALVAGFDEQLSLDVNIDRVVYVFGRNQPPDTVSPEGESSDTASYGQWSQIRIIDVGDTAFGASLDVKGPVAVIGQAADGSPGQAYVVRLE